jgi:hypothetical protein
MYAGRADMLGPIRSMLRIAKSRNASGVLQSLSLALHFDRNLSWCLSKPNRQKAEIFTNPTNVHELNRHQDYDDAASKTANAVNALSRPRVLNMV